MTTTAEPLDAPAIVPGVYDIPAEVYHADPVPGGSLSSSGARKLLPPSCPARFKWERDNPPPPKKVFEVGTAAHKLVLGTGPELVLVDKARWDTDETKAKVAEIRARGAVPLKRSDWDHVHGMAAALRRHPIASALFAPERGQAEQALLWQDRATGVWRRALLDHLPHPTSGRMVVADYKSTTSSSPATARKTVFNYGYHCQGGWYLDGVEALGLARDPAFVLVMQEKEPPYLITVVQLDHESIQLGRELNRRAIDTYARCVETGHWPGYSDQIELITPPAWAASTHHEEYM
ncbi:PD-(D/E)XK nuclease-like domain-containing protein [Nonomuraea turcica]|uniref:PD-(D/E)XK nuclease-like domain-containing protein n=1 Tax=Nonomuraea sp. G32 TaxID=3067274 RepID=UPI00273C734A|nr:PD-(D/E)XK nuclease-like domain-containing protein [Nonomuraea sp. G32]MDP4501013.1 PD-(D/E)XK nuclease-like domain-containing protein [Nonomuraea sp. G32]